MAYRRGKIIISGLRFATCYAVLTNSASMRAGFSFYFLLTIETMGNRESSQGPAGNEGERIPITETEVDALLGTLDGTSEEKRTPAQIFEDQVEDAVREMVSNFKSKWDSRSSHR